MNWLDKYSDSPPKAQVGKNIPKKKPIVVSDKNKATRADSLAVYNNSKEIENFYKKNKYKKSGELSNWEKENQHYINDQTYKDYYDGKGKKLESDFFESSKVLKSEYRKNINENKYLQREQADFWLNTKAPLQLFDRRINPLEGGKYQRGDDAVQIPSYNNIGNKPFDLLTEKEKAERVKKYGTDGVPKSYLDKIKQSSTTTVKVIKKPTQPIILEEQQREKQTPVSTASLNIEPVNSSMELKTSELTPMAIIPKAYKRQTGVDKTFGGWDMTETVEDPNNFSAQKGDWEKITPVYQTGGSLPGAYGMMYARQGAPSNGKYAKKTMPSAQDGTKVDFDYVNYGTPEYEEAYNQGRFANVPNPLDEVVVTPYDKEYPYYQNLSESEKKYISDPSPMGRYVRGKGITGKGFDAEDARGLVNRMLIDAPLGALQVGQSALLEGIEGVRGKEFNMLDAFDPGKQRIPSETWGIENPYAAFAVDAVTDPETLFGASLLRKPIQKGLQQTGEYLTTQTPLKDAYKLNPFAFKPNPEMGYRMLGKEGYQDAIESGVLRAKPVPNQPINGGISLARNTNRNPNTGRMQPALDRPYFADGFIDERYAANYMAAVNKADNNLVPIPTHKGIAPSQAGSIPLENATLYKKDWLKGYKEIPKPTSSIDNVNNKVVGAFSNMSRTTNEQLENAKGFLQRRQFIKNLQNEGLVGKDFNTADLNYTARFNEKTNALTKLALERDATFYRGVSVENEFTPKFNYEGKNFDLSQPSRWGGISEMENMKKAGVNFNNPESIAQYQATHVPMDTYGYRSTGLSTVGDKDFLFMGKRPTPYGNRQFKLKLPRDYSEGNYQDWFNKYYKNKQYVEDLMQRIETTGMPVQNKWDNYFADVPRQKSRNMQEALIGNRGEKIIDVDPTWEVRNYKKNPSQYNEDVDKIQKEFDTGWRGQYKQGGIIKDNSGYWNPDNWGKPVEINSNQITMKGVNQPLLGISDTGDTKLMKPGKDYKFKGKKVTEFPIAKNGMRQEQKGLQNLDNLTNFTNYNKPTVDGWLDKY